MSCSCQIEDYDGEYVAMLSETTPTARKQHTCSECSRTIEKGEKYKRETYVWDDYLNTSKTCADCLSLRTAYFCTYNFGEILSELRDRIFDEGCGEDLLTSQVKNLTPAAKEKLFGMIEECWEKRHG